MGAGGGTHFLAGGLAMRAAAEINLTWAIPELEPEDVSELQPYAADVTSKITICDGLPPIRWDESSPRPLHGITRTVGRFGCFPEDRVFGRLSQALEVFKRICIYA